MLVLKQPRWFYRPWPLENWSRQRSLTLSGSHGSPRIELGCIRLRSTSLFWVITCPLPGPEPQRFRKCPVEGRGGSDDFTVMLSVSFIKSFLNDNDDEDDDDDGDDDDDDRHHHHHHHRCRRRRLIIIIIIDYYYSNEV